MRRIRSLICFTFVIACVAFAAYIVKTKMVEDSKPPVITCEQEEITVSVEDDESALLKGIKAEDNRDGDITKSVRVSSMSHFINGKRTVTYVVFDKANQVGTLERTVQYSDYTSPKIYLKKPLRFMVTNSDELDFEGCYTAEDCLDGDITSQIRPIIDNNYYGIQEGTFAVILQVSNSAGDVCSVPVEMQIAYTDNEDEREKEYPVLSDYIAYTTVGKKINAKKYLVGISRNNTEYLFEDDLTGVKGDDIKITSNVDYEKPGVYTVEYSYKAAGAPKAVTKLYVVVEEK
ncbi:MAG: hypothetical protein ACI4UH_03120 [Dorea sp.]